jgi:SAM-dependent methyltransferase
VPQYQNIDQKTADGFADEWTRFDQSALSEAERAELFSGYFSIFPWQTLSDDAEGFDLGCGSGRWAQLVAPRVGRLHCIDPSAIDVARKNLAEHRNCVFHRASVDRIPLDDNSMDFGYSLGVLHHVPDTQAGLLACVKKLKPGAPLLVYLYYAFDNRPAWFQILWRVSDFLRRGISRLPRSVVYALTQLLAIGVYWPLARAASWLERRGVDVSNFPLSFYRHHSFYTMRTDALDRFGTRLERRFTRPQIRTMMERAGLEHIQLSPTAPFWCAIGYRRR